MKSSLTKSVFLVFSYSLTCLDSVSGLPTNWKNGINKKGRSKNRNNALPFHFNGQLCNNSISPGLKSLAWLRNEAQRRAITCNLSRLYTASQLQFNPANFGSTLPAPVIKPATKSSNLLMKSQIFVSFPLAVSPTAAPVDTVQARSPGACDTDTGSSCPLGGLDDGEKQHISRVWPTVR